MVCKKQKVMTSRDRILSRIKSNQPGHIAGELVNVVPKSDLEPLAKFKQTLVSIGGSVIEVNNETELVDKIQELFADNKTIVGPSALNLSTKKPHDFQNVDLAILRAEFCVAENGAIWITDRSMIDRALPFICSHLALIVPKGSILPTMHEAYERIGSTTYELGTFIAGPSKTADIEQSLVLGAHGAKSLICFLIG